MKAKKAGLSPAFRIVPDDCYLRRATPPMPEQAVESVQRDVEMVKEAVQR